MSMSHTSELCDRVTEYRLVYSDSTWSRQRADCGHNDGLLSKAKIYESSTEDGIIWTVVSPIIFSYRVIQCERLLEANNDTLLFGHIADPVELQALKGNGKIQKRFVVIDETVDDLYGCQVKAYFESRGVTYKILPLPTTEENKSMRLVIKILEEVHKFGIDRRTEPIIAIGGGVCLDVVGLAASLYRRRTPYIRVPTTLLAYIDASVGAKTGVNFSNCKNKLGTYIPPIASFLDKMFLRSLPRRHISNGLAEMLKMALMKHRGLFELLEKEGRGLLESNFQGLEAARVSSRLAIESMLEELAPNLWEDQLDRLVDFGHIISPQLEMNVLPALLHGEAVNIDMAFMVYVSHERGFLSEEDKCRIIECMRSLDLPVWHSHCSLDLVQKSLRERIQHSAGLQRMPLPIALGQGGIFNDTEESVVCRAFEKWNQELHKDNVDVL
ncbi:hypothetical protein DNTS_034451 [Danionella cerebrum]|uniref:Uncharacterized protein n=1 Tax=Danionella cerebrum TaxID=2873325 RepID=A0A553PW29_9TELE|nr:hypothetical protein DNTS_034451 [Danionella translucida]